MHSFCHDFEILRNQVQIIYLEMEMEITVCLDLLLNSSFLKTYVLLIYIYKTVFLVNNENAVK